MLRLLAVLISVTFAFGTAAEAKSHAPKLRVSMKKPPVVKKHHKREKAPAAQWGTPRR